LFARFESGADTIAPNLGKVIAAELDHLDAHWPARLPAGIIHADLFPDNVFFLGGRLSGLIDFYFACNDAFAYDIAICLNAWCFEPDFTFNVTKGRALLNAYEDVRPLAQAEREALPVLARGSALRFLLTRSHDWLHTPKDRLVRPHDPIAYLRRLRFHQGVRSIREYGLEERR
jgi:homoserine kinase type II